MELADEQTMICAYCTEYDCDNYYCPHKGKEVTLMPEDTCDGFNPKAEQLTEKEEKDIVGDMEAHRIMVEGEIVE